MYCTRSDLTDYLLADYLAAVDKIDAEKVARTMANVESEMSEALVSGGYTVTANDVPATVKRICATLSAYRSVSAITSLVVDENSSDNEFLPLQRQAERAEKEMDQIRLGKIRLAPPEATSAQPNDTVIVVTPPRKFKDWSRF
ncbi:phage protein Gp36 family protein [Maridesulfovibrio bastinii]|uniref:phage protein Gp36 family protein n=1 Tax=Maridesulfovibrio bastinii TaxID=47157 RepID=UPI0003FDC2CC|nr:phage protein Gp36 family protein [Maridesulfovibrio bastinii]